MQDENITEESKTTESELSAQDRAKLSNKNNKYVHSHGRRKEAVARVRLFKGRGEILVNDKPLEKYFETRVLQIQAKKPLVVTNTEGSYYATVRVGGSGKASQLDAVVHGIARALIVENPEFRVPLKKAGLLTRDPRVKERRKYGLAQKARKGKQSPKR